MNKGKPKPSRTLKEALERKEALEKEAGSSESCE
jgi:hypothetical protein